MHTLGLPEKIKHPMARKDQIDFPRLLAQVIDSIDILGLGEAPVYLSVVYL